MIPPSSRSLRSAGGRELWEKMAAAVHPRAVRVLPMSRKCHWENGPGLGFRDRLEMLGVAPCCSGHADALDALDFLDPWRLRPFSFSFPSGLQLTNSEMHLGRGLRWESVSHGKGRCLTDRENPDSLRVARVWGSEKYVGGEGWWRGVWKGWGKEEDSGEKVLNGFALRPWANPYSVSI